MLKKTLIIALASLLFFSSNLFSAESNKISKEELLLLVQQQKLLANVKPPKQVPSKTGKAISWTVNHLVQLNGWSFTGWSKLYLNKNMERRWLKLGLISGELNAFKVEDMTENEKRRDFIEWESQLEQEPIFGFFFVLEF